ncbi:MAG: hypothetical protein N4A38_05630 [Candidatus Gracilibacteria bacterium]|jgi:hypothetical protein|nr:hypothetical protein [Candidatus Gracilibacteria bacterium]
MIFAVKNQGESNEKFILRYKKMFFQTRMASKIKTTRYAVKAPSKRKVREQAIIRDAYRKANANQYD